MKGKMKEVKETIRERHFKQFGLLSPEEQLAWALSHGHTLRSLLPKEERDWADRLRNGGKRTASPAGNDGAGRR
jgi:hypothetical protein